MLLHAENVLAARIPNKRMEKQKREREREMEKKRPSRQDIEKINLSLCGITEMMMQTSGAPPPIVHGQRLKIGHFESKLCLPASK